MNEEETRQWVKANADLMPNIPLAPDELDHIAMCMQNIYRWYYEGYPLGDFLTAVVKDQFAEACIRADDVNRKALYLYAMFCLNKIGSDYQVKALGKKKGGE